MCAFRPPESYAPGGHPTAYPRKAAEEPAAAGAGTLPFELAAMRHLVDPALLEAVARRSEALGVGGDEVLRTHDILSSDEIAQTLAGKLGLIFDPLENTARTSLPVLDSVRAGILRRGSREGVGIYTVAPRGLKIRALAEAIKENPALRVILRLTSPERLDAYIRNAGAEELAHEASSSLHDWRPDLSAAARGRYGLRKLALLTAAFGALAGYFFPQGSLAAAEFLLGTAFLTWIGLRLHACQMRSKPPPALDLPDQGLPCYTIVIALYREARIVGQLVDALKRLDYPPEKLDIKFVCERDDSATVEALNALYLDPRFEILLAPESGPRTKPKALAAALPFARGRYLVVYDAEDVPEPDQLKKALAAYRRGPRNLACVQARLAVDNVRDNWLTRHFAAEYAGLFDVFLPALADLRMPLPLGGTSNHFRTDILRGVGGWDPYNVTEDADLGMRLARFGYLSGVIDSTTYEEAPARLGAWLKQRTRWCKGWLQTWLVHMRAPGVLYRELGASGFFAFQLLVGGTVLAALVHPIFLALVLTDATLGDLLQPSDSIAEAFRHGFAMTTLLSGYFGSALLSLVGLARRRLLSSAWVLVLTPLYWIILSFAAWRAAIQLVIAPHLWEKTEHGLARTSRYGKSALKPPELSAPARRFKVASANRPPRRRRYAPY
ncbi:MAG TPA: glycosyltransferase [Xanthobacteraceae bacterium]|nr:glycosyltransferase [Xanthobacteraceae bacterium]